MVKYMFFLIFQNAVASHTFTFMAGFSASGDVHAELVYVNYGRPEDYALLEEQVQRIVLSVQQFLRIEFNITNVAGRKCNG